MNYALIGCGRIAENHIQAVQDTGLDLCALCDIDPQKTDDLLNKFDNLPLGNIKRYTDYRRMIAEMPELELCAIATPSGSHAEIAKNCIKSGINVIIEKPIAMSIGDADEIIRLATEYNVTAAVCHQNRFNNAIQEMRKALEAGRFGKISHGSICVRWHRDETYYNQAQWRGTWSDDGGCLMNQCIHGIDLLRWMLGDEVESVFGTIRQQNHPYLQTEDVGMAVLQFKNGAIATIEGTTNLYRDDLEEILMLSGSDGTVKIGGICANQIDVWDFKDVHEGDETKSEEKEIVRNVYGNGHSRLYADVIDAINNKRKPYVDAVDGRNALEIVLAIYQSHKTGKAVSLPVENFRSIEMEGVPFNK